MRILQIIDSLSAGGAERMAVNYANALSHKIEFSGLVSTRAKGPLENQIDDKVDYLFLNKKNTFDLKALTTLRKFVKKNKIDYIHAHSTSFFLAFLLKLSLPSIKLIWHDHYGDSEFLEKRPTSSLKLMMPFFNGIISVNHTLKDWSKKKLKFENVIYLPNFPSLDKENSELTLLEGIQGKRVVCLANLRAQKNHHLLLQVAQKIKLYNSEWTFHLVGKDFNDLYSNEIKDLIVSLNLTKNVFFYGSREDVKNILDQSTIAVLTSNSEGLPLALLEYGLHKLPVVVTNVGEIPNIIDDCKNGFVVDFKDENTFYKRIVELIENESIRLEFSSSLQATIIQNFSQDSILDCYMNWLIKTE